MADRRRRWRLVAGVLGAVVAGALAVAWLRTNAGAGGPGDAALLAAVDDANVALVDDGPAVRIGVEAVGDEGRVVGAGRGRALLLGAVSTQLVRLGDAAAVVAPGGLTPSGPWAILGPHRVRGVVLGVDGAATVAVDLETGRSSLIEDLVEPAGEHAAVTSYATDGTHATVLVAGETWLVRITGQPAARRLDATWAGFSGTGERLAVLRAGAEGAQTLHLVPVEGGDERELWAGADVVQAAWAGDGVVLVDRAGVTRVDAADGAARRIIDVPVDPASPELSRGTVAAGLDDRWWRLDETGEEVPELRGLDPLPGGHPLADRVVFVRAGGDPVVVAWNVHEQAVDSLTATPEQLARLTEGHTTQSPDGRYLATGAATAAGAGAVLADFQRGSALDLGVERAGEFAPDGGHLVVVTETSAFALLDPSKPAQPAEVLTTTVDPRVEPGWVYP